MAQVTLSEPDQNALRAHLAVEPVPGRPVPEARTRFTEVANDLSPCRDDSCDGCPHYLGYMHWNKHPREAEWCDVDIAGSDCLAVGFRNGAQHIVQFFFARNGGQFSETELALQWTLGPVLQRLGRERPTPQLPATLTMTERRILTYVAAGLSNSEIAEQITVATSTVRKHLENIYRKLGVGNSTAAVARLQGRDVANLDLKERLDRYALAPGAETG